MKLKIVISAFFAAFTLSSATIFAQPPPEPMDESHEMGMSPDKQFEDPSLHLNKEQKEKIKKIFEDNKPEMKKNKKELLEKMKAFHEAYIDDKKREEDITKIHEEVEELHKKMMVIHYKTMMQIRSILTSEQRKQFFENMKERKHKNRKDHKEKD